MAKQISVFVKADMPSRKQICQMFMKNTEDNGLQRVNLQFFEEQDIWVGSIVVPNDGPVQCKFQICPKVDINDEIAAQMGGAWVDLCSEARFEKKAHLIMYAHVSYLWQNPLMVKSYAVDGSNMIFLNKMCKSLVPRDGVVSLTGDVVELNKWNYSKKSYHLEHGLSVTPATIALDTQIEFKNTLSAWRYNTSLHDTNAYFDICNDIWWEPDHHWNKSVRTPIGDQVVRVVGSVWGQVHSVRTCDFEQEISIPKLRAPVFYNGKLEDVIVNGKEEEVITKSESEIVKQAQLPTLEIAEVVDIKDIIHQTSSAPLNRRSSSRLGRAKRRIVKAARRVRKSLSLRKLLAPLHTAMVRML